VAAVLNEFAESAAVEIEITESSLPVSSRIESLCDVLGIDPLFLACEGRVIFVVAGKESGHLLEILKKVPGGENASLIGRIVKGKPGRVTMITRLGGRRILDMPVGEPLPRIC
ncbi:MAG: hydrogenase expression/formation protein HypE, partial [Candidatus Eremiobacteraeota bacterium]|nr:hydrogenase expression/formation protein HypE [Candidatus Eremiobacteraeota bacterium]